MTKEIFDSIVFSICVLYTCGLILYCLHYNTKPPFRLSMILCVTSMFSAISLNFIWMAAGFVCYHILFDFNGDNRRWMKLINKGKEFCKRKWLRN